MGEYDLATDEEEFPYIERKVQIVASHPQFDSRTFEYDLALLRFYDPVRFQPNIVPICLPPPSEVDFVGRTAFVTGWGRLYEGMNTWSLRQWKHNEVNCQWLKYPVPIYLYVNAIII